MAVLKDLIVHGNSRFLNTSYFNQLNTDKIGAEEGIFNKIVATTGDIGSLTVDDLTAGKATVLSLLDIRGELHTNQWTNSNIATIDGSFYITPTIGVPSGTMTTTANSVVINGSNFPISSLYVNGVNSDNTATTVAWTSGSKVLVTGEILVNGVYMPLGTLIGTLSANATASQIQVGSITDNRYQSAESLAEIGTQSTALPCRNVKISLYQTSRSSTLYPLGIFMTALGENGKTFLDIYGGGYATSTATAGGFAKPVLRIGNLAGLPAVGGSTPTGYGIYTSNGYFSGAIVAKQGKIGDGTAAWTIGNDSNSRAYIYSGITNITTSGSTTGTYVGTNGISNYNSATQYVNLTGGKITAQGADIAGKITASSGSIGGWNIGTDTNKSLYYGNQTPGATTTNLVLSPTSATNSNAIGGSGTGLTWFISAGKVFGVTTAGALYSTSGKIGEFNIGTTYLRNGNITSATNTSVAGVYLGTDGLNISNGTAATTSYITKTAVNIGNKLTWNGTTLTIDGSASIGGTTASTVVSNAADGAAAKTGLDNLEIGGRNLIPLSSNLKSFIIENASYATATWTDSNVTILNISTNPATYGIFYQWIPVEPNTTYTLSFTCSSVVGTARSAGGFRKSDNTTIGSSLWNHTVLNYAQVSNGHNVRTFTTPDESATMRVYFSTTNKDSQMIISNVKIEKGNKATDWSPAPEDLDVHKYVTDIDSNNGITIKPINTAGNDYLQINSSAISFYRNNVETLKLEDSALRVGKVGTNLRNIYITNSEVQIRNNTTAIAKFGSTLTFYEPGTSTVAAEVDSNGINVKVGTFGNATNKITVGTGTSGHSAIRYGMTTLADTDNDGFYIGTDGIALGKGAFKVTSGGAITATSGTIGGFNLTASELYYDHADPGVSNSTFVIYPNGIDASDVSEFTSLFMGDDTQSNIKWTFTVGQSLGITTDGQLYANAAKIIGTIESNGSTVSTLADLQATEGKLSADIANLNDELVDAKVDLQNSITLLSNEIKELLSINNVNLLSSTILSEVTMGKNEWYSIGAGDNRISFNTSNYQEFAYLTNEKLYLNQIELTDRISIANSLTIANFQWINRSGRLTLMKI